MTPGLLILGGLVALVAGAELLVAGASRVAARLGVSSVVIGLTVVAFGTSAPELAVSTGAALRGDSDIALGNVVGSNIFNVLFILGISALARPLRVAPSFVRIDVPVMIAVSLVLWVLAANGALGRLEGALLVTGIVVYTGVQVTASRRAGGAGDDRSPRSSSRLVTNLALVLGGLAMLVAGSTWFVQGAREVAQNLGVSDLVIGLTLVAAGTSLPELATSLVATIRGEREIAVGNVVGSNIFNLLAILGVASLLGPQGIQVDTSALRFDLPVMALVAALCLPIFLSGGVISRKEGVLLTASYMGYVAWLGAEAAGVSLPGVSTFVAVPVAGTLIVLWWLLARRGDRRVELA